jgi:hypothetical protein
MEVYRWENPPTEWGVSSHATFDDTEGSSRNSSWSTHVPPKWALQVHGVPITTPHCFSRNRMIQMNPNDVSMVSVLGFPDFFCTSRTFLGWLNQVMTPQRVTNLMAERRHDSLLGSVAHTAKIQSQMFTWIAGNTLDRNSVQTKGPTRTKIQCFTDFAGKKRDAS